jgi:hypothetical protein
MMLNQIPAHEGRARFECKRITLMVRAVKRHGSLAVTTQRVKRSARAARHGVP